MGRLAHALAMRAIAARLRIPCGDETQPPERALVAYVHGQLGEVARLIRCGTAAIRWWPCPPWTETRPALAAHPGRRGLRRGQGRVWVVYHGTRLVEWDGGEGQGGRLTLQRQAALQHHQPVVMSLADFARLHERLGRRAGSGLPSNLGDARRPGGFAL